MEFGFYFSMLSNVVLTALFAHLLKRYNTLRHEKMIAEVQNEMVEYRLHIMMLSLNKELNREPE